MYYGLFLLCSSWKSRKLNVMIKVHEFKYITVYIFFIDLVTQCDLFISRGMQKVGITSNSINDVQCT